MHGVGSDKDASGKFSISPRGQASQSPGKAKHKEGPGVEIVTRIDGLSEQHTQELAEALTADQALRAPVPPILDLQCKVHLPLEHGGTKTNNDQNTLQWLDVGNVTPVGRHRLTSWS